MKSRAQIIGQRIAALIGGIAAIPLSVWGFVIGGDFIGSWTQGFLAFPGALLGAVIVVACGAGLGRLLFLVGLIAWRALSRKAKPWIVD